MMDLGYYIEKEKYIKEKDIIYVILVFKKGQKKYQKEILSLGINMININIYHEFLKNKLNKNMRLLKNISSKQIIRRLKIYQLNRWINKRLRNS